MAYVFACPVTQIFQLSIREGAVPQEWKMSDITPIFKKVSKMEPSNYRPVNLTSVVCKVMETLVREHIVAYVQDNNLFTPVQRSFLQGRSCTTNLLEVLDIWTQWIEEGSSVDVIYMDLQKAFSTVPHQ